MNNTSTPNTLISISKTRLICHWITTCTSIIRGSHARADVLFIVWPTISSLVMLYSDIPPSILFSSFHENLGHINQLHIQLPGMHMDVGPSLIYWTWETYMSISIVYEQIILYLCECWNSGLLVGSYNGSDNLATRLDNMNRVSLDD